MRIELTQGAFSRPAQVLKTRGHTSYPTTPKNLFYYSSVRDIFQDITAYFVYSRLVKMPSRLSSVMAFCPVCLGIAACEQ